MKEEISKNIIKQLCNDFVDAICVDLKEYPDEFPYTLAFINSLKQENDSLITKSNFFSLIAYLTKATISGLAISKSLSFAIEKN
mgnify:CR=1 FL=1